MGVDEIDQVHATLRGDGQSFVAQRVPFHGDEGRHRGRRYVENKRATMKREIHE